MDNAARRARRRHNRGMSLVRIDPRHGPLWRDTRTLQFGVSGSLRLQDPAPWQERAVDQLERGMACESAAWLLGHPERLAHAVGGPTTGLASLLAALEPVLETIEPDGSGVGVRTADAVAPEIAGTVVDALSDEGWPAIWLTPDEEPVDPATPIVLIGANALPPHLGARCVRADAPHLPIVFDAAGAHIGPVVVPGTTACLACLDRHRTDADPAWPVLASQLLLREPPRVAMSLAVESAALAARLLHDGPDHSDGEAVTASALIEHRSAGRGGRDHTRRWSSHRPHPECLCRAPVAAGAAATAHPRRAA